MRFSLLLFSLFVPVITFLSSNIIRWDLLLLIGNENAFYLEFYLQDLTPGGVRRRGGLLNKILYGSLPPPPPPRSKPLPFYVPFLTENVPLSHTYKIKGIDISFNFSAQKSLNCLNGSTVWRLCSRYF